MMSGSDECWFWVFETVPTLMFCSIDLSARPTNSRGKLMCYCYFKHTVNKPCSIYICLKIQNVYTQFSLWYQAWWRIGIFFKILYWRWNFSVVTWKLRTFFIGGMSISIVSETQRGPHQRLIEWLDVVFFLQYVLYLLLFTLGPFSDIYRLWI